MAQRPVKLRQIEALRSLIVGGSVTRAAELMRVSQPAVSKLLAHLEKDSGLVLFHRMQGRLIPTTAAIRVYEEMERIFAGVQKIESAIEAIKRELSGRLVIGATPALSEVFIPRILTKLLRRHPDLYVSVRVNNSRLLGEWLKTRQIDVALMTGPVDNPLFHVESFQRYPLVCMIPDSDPLARKSVIVPSDLDGRPFISPMLEGQTRQTIDQFFTDQGVRLNAVIDTGTVSGVSDLVAAGFGVSLLHPLFAKPRHGKLTVRRFEPTSEMEFLICRAKETRNPELVDAFFAETHAVSNAISGETVDPILRSI